MELPGVAPDNASLGVMLPYAPLHHLLFKFGAPSPLVLTSANRSSEPIAFRDDEAIARLAGIADAFLIGERQIARRVDDSVVTVHGGRPFMIRRGRGFSPSIVCRLAKSGKGVGNLFSGGIASRSSPASEGGKWLSDTFSWSRFWHWEAISRMRSRWSSMAKCWSASISAILGDAGTDAAFEETIRDLLAMYEIRIEDTTVVHDLHPQFTSTRLAESLPARRRLGGAASRGAHRQRHGGA